MNIKPVASPHQVMPTNANPQAAAEAKARAISILTGGQQQTAQPVVNNQNSVTPEEMTALAPTRIDSQTSNVESAQVTEDTEVPAPQPPPKEVEDPALSRQFAQLARQEKALRAKVQAQDLALKQREAAIAQREADLASKQPDLSKYIPRDRLKTDPLSVLAEAEVSYDDLTNQIINRQPVDPQVQATINQLKSEIQELKQANEDGKKSQTDAQKQQYDAAVNQIRLDAKRLVQTDPAFETIKATNSISDVVELITETFNKDGVLLSVEEAAQQVEDYLIEEAMKIAKIQKIQSRLGIKPESPKPVQAQQQQTAQPKPQQQPMKTLTNASASTRQLSARERAMLAFKGELK